MSKLRFITANFTTRNTDMVIKGHNKKFTIPLNPDNFTYDKHGEVYYFKYDAKKEEAGNMQKRYASAFCSYLTERYGGNFVQDIPGEAIVRGSDKEDYHTTLKGIYSHSYRNDERIVTTLSASLIADRCGVVTKIYSLALSTALLNPPSIPAGQSIKIKSKLFSKELIIGVSSLAPNLTRQKP